MDGTFPGQFSISRPRKACASASVVALGDKRRDTARIIAKAEALAEQQRQDVATAAKRADNLVAELFEAKANFSRCPSGSRAPATDEVRG